MKPVPSLHYPSSLPITHKRHEIVQTIRNNQVLILSGETGSGKTTQVPKMCLEAGLGQRGIVCCTQPRRIAALTIAARIAEELKREDLVGCRMRFHDTCSKSNQIRVLTDGILLSEAQNHSRLRQYSAIIIDEAHERSLNIDVLLGMMRRLVDKRTDLKLIITSATLDTDKFSRHFDNAPIIEVSGRTFPVDIRYRLPDSPELNSNSSLAEQTITTVRSIVDDSKRGDILAFLPTEQDIRETAALAAKDFGDYLNIRQLYARLPSGEQKKAFETGGRRKLVIATNVAETSLTIPGIRYVVDTGLARTSRYSPGAGTQGLPVEPISRASADQRAGRCGRVENGVCIRLYTEEDYLSRPLFTLPEIQRSNLAEVMLKLLDLNIPDIEKFPFVDPPDSAAIRDGLRTLNEIGAIVSAKVRTLTPDGKLMARLPLDPRLAKMLIHASRENCLGDVLPITAALSVREPWDVPTDNPGKAQSIHASFRYEFSDFVTRLNLWDSFRSSKDSGSFSGKLKRFCKLNYLSYRRMLEWIDVHRQLALIMEENGYRLRRTKSDAWTDKKGNFTPRYAAIHRSILSGLLSHIAQQEESRDYKAARNRIATLHPASALRKEPPEWIVAAEMIRTSRLFARSAATIDPIWLEELGSHLISKSWINPGWDKKTGTVLAEEQSRLYGFLVARGKTVPYGPIRFKETRDIFIRSALVESDSSDLSGYSFLKHNRQMLKRLEAMEIKLRRRDLLVGDEAIASFYDNRLPPDVLDVGTLNRALKSSKHLEKRLHLTEEDLLTGVDIQKDLQQFPDKVKLAGETWKLNYVFDPQSKRDGVTLNIPSGRLSQIQSPETDWMVPGLLKEKIEALMRGLPKPLRRKISPIADTAQAALKGMKRKMALIHSLSHWLYHERSIDIPPKDWNTDALPAYLKVRYRLLSDAGREVAAGYDIAHLEPANEGQRIKRLTPGGPASSYKLQHELIDLKDWPETMDVIPESVSIGGNAVLWAGLQDDKDSVSLRFFDLQTEADRSHAKGQVRLGLMYWAREMRGFRQQLQLSGQARALAHYLGGPLKLEDAVWERVAADIFAGELLRRRSEWQCLRENGGQKLFPSAQNSMAMISEILSAYGNLREQLTALAQKSYRRDFIAACLADADALLNRNFIADYPLAVWQSIPRWIKAMEVHARRGSNDPACEQRFSIAWTPLFNRYRDMEDNLSPMATDRKRQALAEAGILLEELRVALSAAGEIKPAGKISESRMKKILDEIERML